MESVASFFSGLVTIFAVILGIVVTLIVVILVAYALVLRDSFEQGEKAELEKERLRKEAMSDTRPIYCRYCGARPGVPSKCHGSQGHDWVRGN